jgi:small nuclear ribonucleoprotein (snRNP)-like protein
MTDLTALVIFLGAILVLFAFGGGCLFAFRLQRRVLTSRMRKVVAITTNTNETFRGVLAEHDDQAFVLTKARQYVRNDETVEVPGELIVLREDVAYIQSNLPV